MGNNSKVTHVLTPLTHVLTPLTHVLTPLTHVLTHHADDMDGK
jgi:hypothetical protein